ncbi:MAG: polysaccharide deacetylase family protein [Cyclobacteriaceae bacterium]
MNGNFIISLDLELFWGVHDEKKASAYHSNLKETPKAIERLLATFVDYSIHATFATVGFLMGNKDTDISKHFSDLLPSYTNKNLSPYQKLTKHSADTEDTYFALPLIKKIATTSGMEIASHTFSHYYTLEEGQQASEFQADLISAISIANEHQIDLQSIVFPRNQYNDTYLAVCKKLGIAIYRGNEKSWIYKPEAWSKETLFKKGIRLIDSYINLTGNHTYKPQLINGFLNLPSSRFLRPYSSKLACLQALKLRRIRKAMTYAAKNKLTYHLWWHPHNFGSNLEKNMAFLTKILDHYQELNATYGFKSQNMKDIHTTLSNL